MFIPNVTAFAERFLSDRSFELIVAPAIADFEYDRSEGPRIAAYVAVLRATAGAIYEDCARSSAAGTFIALAVIPAAYYAFFFLLCAPAGLRTIASNRLVALLLVGLTSVASMMPVAICYWPERQPRRPAQDAH